MSLRSIGSSLLMCGVGAAAVLAAVAPSFAVTGARSGMDYYFLREGSRSRYNGIVRQFAFNTSLQLTIEDDILVGMTMQVDNLYTSFSTAVLIGDQYLLTAAHCVLDYGWYQYEIGGEIYTAEQWWIPAGFNMAGEVHAFLWQRDIALVKLDRPVSDPNIPRMDWIRGTDADYRESGAKFTMVGYGLSEQPEAPVLDPLIGGLRRAAENRYDVIASPGQLQQHLNLIFDLDQYTVGTPPLDGFKWRRDWPIVREGAVLPGDSGGPSIIDGRIVGVHSYIFTASMNGGDPRLHGVDMDVRRFWRWIEEIVERPNDPIPPGGFGYEFGLAGITIDDIREDLQRDTPVLYPWLEQMGYFDGTTQQGTSPFFALPLEDGIIPGDHVSMSQNMNIQLQPQFIDRARDAATQWGMLTGPEIRAGMLNEFVEAYGVEALQVAALNPIFYSKMFDPNFGGMFTHMVQLPPFVPGDTNGDGVVDGADLDFILEHWQNPLANWDELDEPPVDFNDPAAVEELVNSHYTDEDDLNDWLANRDVELTQAMIDQIFAVTGILVSPDGDSGAVVVAEHIFYNGSAWDGNDLGASAADDNAIAPDKVALEPGQTASFANYTSYSRGINGIMIDVQGLGDLTPTATDFEFRVGNNGTPGSWAAGPVPSIIDVRQGAGVNGSDRVTIIWPDNAIQKQWLQVTVKANDVTKLAEPHVFYFGNAIGETGNSSTNTFVDAMDYAGVRDNPRSGRNPATIDFPWDINRDRSVDVLDAAIIRDNPTSGRNAVVLITVP